MEPGNSRIKIVRKLDVQNPEFEFVKYNVRMKQMILGVFGYKNCGRTSLIASLVKSGFETKGAAQKPNTTKASSYTPLKLPDGTNIELLDMPDYKENRDQFIADATGIDMAILVLAADEEILPQLNSHIEILQLLKVKICLAAITKCDLVDKSQSDKIEAEFRQSMIGRIPAGLEFIRVSVKSGKGIQALKKYIMQAVSRAESRDPVLPVRLLVDSKELISENRVSLAGALVSGTIRAGDPLHIMPGDVSCKVSTLLLHGKKVKETSAATYLTLTITGDKINELNSFSLLAAPGSVKSVRSFAGKFSIIPEFSQIKISNEKVKIYCGRTVNNGEISFFEEVEKPSELGFIFARIECDQPVVCSVSDKYLVWSCDPGKIIGGGEIAELEADMLSKTDSELLQHLMSNTKDSPENAVTSVLCSSPTGLKKSEIQSNLKISDGDLKSALDALTSQSRIVLMPFERYMLAPALDALIVRIRSLLAEYHGKFPERNGMPKTQLETAIGKVVGHEVLASILASRNLQKQFSETDLTIRLADFTPEMNDRQRNLLQRIETVYRYCGIFIPTIEAVCTEINVSRDAVLAILNQASVTGVFVRISPEEFYHTETVDKIKSLVDEYVREHGPVSVSEFRDLTDSNRKFALQALEYLDKIEFTLRDGDRRRLLKS